MSRPSPRTQRPAPATLQEAQRKELDERSPVARQRSKKFNLEDELQAGARRGALPLTQPAQRPSAPYPWGARRRCNTAAARPCPLQRLKDHVDLNSYENKPVPRPKED